MKSPKETTIRSRRLALFFALLLCVMAKPAHAVCTAPAGKEGDQIYNSAYHVWQFCNNTTWIPMGATASPESMIAAGNVGDTNIESSYDHNDANTLLANPATLSNSGTLTSLSIYINIAAGNLILGIYDNTGPNGAPGSLLGTTNSFAATTGWNTHNLVTPVYLTSGNYWLAFLPDDNSLQIAAGTNYSVYYYSYTFGALPGTFSTTLTPWGGGPYSLYGTISSQCGGQNFNQIFGRPIVGNVTECNDANYISAHRETLPVSGTIQSLSLYLSTAAGNLTLGIYDATGPNGGPGALLATTASFATSSGWNTQNVVTPVPLTAGNNYWLAWLPDNNSLCVKRVNNGYDTWYGYSYGALPNPYSTSPTTATVSYSMYATLSTPSPGPVAHEGDRIYNNDYHTWQFCNGNLWLPMEPAVTGGGGGGCSSPTGKEADQIYNSASHIWQFCDGTNWKAFGGTAWSPSPTSSDGYFVMSKSTWNGNLGDRSGADSLCLTELTTNTGWKGYTEANSRGILTSGHVHAFLCSHDGSGACTVPAASTTYYFADANDATHGGASFTTDASSLGPNDNADWSSPSHFGGTYYYWDDMLYGTSATWGNSLWSTANGCGGGGIWNDGTSGSTGSYGHSDSASTARWYAGAGPTCDNVYNLICFVDP